MLISISIVRTGEEREDTSQASPQTAYPYQPCPARPAAAAAAAWSASCRATPPRSAPPPPGPMGTKYFCCAADIFARVCWDIVAWLMCERSWLVRVPGTGAGPGEGAGLLLELQTKVHTKFRNHSEDTIKTLC